MLKRFQQNDRDLDMFLKPLCYTLLFHSDPTFPEIDFLVVDALMLFWEIDDGGLMAYFMYYNLHFGCA